MDPEDTSWIDGADEEIDHHVPVKVMVERSNNAPAKRPALSHTDFGLEVCSALDEIEIHCNLIISFHSAQTGYWRMTKRKRSYVHGQEVKAAATRGLVGLLSVQPLQDTPRPKSRRAAVP